MRAVWGEWAGRAAAVFFALYYAYYAYIEIVRMLLYTKQWSLPQTTPWLVMLLMLIPTYTVARGGSRILGRYIELIFFLSLMVPLPYLYTLQDAHWLHLLPVVKDGWRPILSAFRESLLYYTGFGVSLMLYPFLEHKDKASAGIVISSTLSMLAYLFIVIVCFVYFSPDEMKLYNDPVINILKTIQFKFIERFEVLMTSFFLFLFSTSWITTLYLCAFCTSWLFQRQDHRPHLRLLCLIVGIGTYFYMPTFNESGRIVQFFGRIAIGVEYVLPVCLLLYMAAYDRLRRRRIE
ncbi:spore germination protein [Paenibacillus sp. P25]|nr:spore germination protein [Paenibacillus sp. P25]